MTKCELIKALEPFSDYIRILTPDELSVVHKILPSGEGVIILSDNTHCTQEDIKHRRRACCCENCQSNRHALTLLDDIAMGPAMMENEDIKRLSVARCLLAGVVGAIYNPKTNRYN